MLDRRHGMLERPRAPAILAFAEVEHQVRNGKSSAASRARLISSIASMRRDFSG